jgi:hypothetical protein
MSGEPILYAGVFSIESSYSVGQVVSVNPGEYTLPGLLHVYSAGGLYICRDAVSPTEVFSGAVALPGETSRDRLRVANLGAGGAQRVPEETPATHPFASVLPADVRGPQGLQGSIGPAGPEGPPGIPSTFPLFMGSWSSSGSYYTGNLVTSAGGLNVYALTKQTSPGNPFTSSVPPESDAPDWSLVMQFPDSSTASQAATWISAISTLVSMGAAIASAVIVGKQVVAGTATTATNALTGLDTALGCVDEFDQA